MQIGYGPFEAYGFHALEGLQCMVERRKGAETGVKAVTCHTGKEMWDALDSHEWAKSLLDAGLKLVKSHAAGDMRELAAKDKEAGIFEIEYRDGLRAFVVMPNGWIHENDGGSFYFACQRKGEEKPDVLPVLPAAARPLRPLRGADEGDRLADPDRPRTLPGRAHAADHRHPRRGDDEPAREGKADRNAAPGDRVHTNSVGRSERDDSKGEISDHGISMMRTTPFRHSSSISLWYSSSRYCRRSLSRIWC